MEPVTPEKDIFEEIAQLRERPLVLFLDLDGTLVPLQDDYRSVTIAEGTQKLLVQLNTSENRKVVIVSGRTQGFLELHLGTRGLDFGAEHGSMFFDAATGTWHPLVADSFEPIYRQVKKEMEGAEFDVPGSDLEEKEHSLAWHYRMAKPAEDFILMFLAKLQQVVKGSAFSIMHGNKVIEAKPVGITKEAFIRWYLKKNEDRLNGWLPIAIGDDRTDEDMFIALESLGGVSIKVGDGKTVAKYRLPNVTGVLELLSRLAPRTEESPGVAQDTSVRNG